jgi:ectoine hydroxylase-related dioxygenase (phytanoyl-CoA dioxygenase family)
MYLPTIYKISYDTQEFPFKETMKRILGVDDLEKLHLEKDYAVLSRENDQKTHWHRLYYDSFQEFSPLYQRFVKHLKKRYMYAEIVYQKIPTFRAHLVGNLGVGEWHKDKTYNHGVDEVNFWLPFTDAYDTNTIWLESIEDAGDYRPYAVDYGEVLVFSGANLNHGNKINETQDTRVSVDFRLVDPAKFVSNSEKSINGVTTFTLGGYFEKL